MPFSPNGVIKTKDIVSSELWVTIDDIQHLNYNDIKFKAIATEK